MALGTTPSTAAGIIHDFTTSGDSLTSRSDLARFLRQHHLVGDDPVAITHAEFDEAIALRDGMRACLLRAQGGAADTDAIAQGQRVLDGLRMTARMEPAEDGTDDPSAVLCPAVVSELRRGLARIAAAWAAITATGETVELSH
ncbi:ABATE domain-containing protein [Haloactinospora alba]|nr:ABATE domain-containing protein [Haloactinospora alba]